MLRSSFRILSAALTVVACQPQADTAAPTTPAAPSAEKPPEPTRPAYPPTEQRAVTDQYHGVSVTEDYRWLENWSDPAVVAWSESQNQFARTQLDALPDLPGVRARVEQIYQAKVVDYWKVTSAAGRIFALKAEPPKQQAFLVELSSLDESTSRTVIDPNVLDATGGTSIDWFVPSPDGKRLAVSLSRGGSEIGDLHIFDTESGQLLEAPIVRVNQGTAGGAMAWDPDGEGFFYTRYPRPGERPDADLAFYLQVYHHKLGTPESADRHEFGHDLPRIAEIDLDLEPTSGRLLVTVQNGDGGEFAHYLRDAKGKWTTLSQFGDRTVQANFGGKDDIYLISRKGAPRGQVLRMSALRPDPAHAQVVVPQGDESIVSGFWGAPTLRVVGERLYVTYQLGGPTELRAFTLDGKPATGPQQLPVSSVGAMAPGPNNTLLFTNGSFVQPSAYYLFDPATGQTRKTALAPRPVVDFSDIEVRREFAVSTDGTRVPMNILARKGTQLDGQNPVVVYGYGGYGNSITPYYKASYGVLLEQGVVYVLANLRGGAEYGEAWHRAGALTNKQNVFDDFAAVVRHLHQRQYSNPDRTAVMGASNGGLLIGATIVQHPELVKAAVAKVGLYDMLRVELSPNGAFNIPEFGTVKDPTQFEALYAYSPYHRVREGVEYPAVLFTTGANDPRVDPMQSRKMTARLQAASAGQGSILLRTTANAGHGSGSPLNVRIDQSAHVYAFLLSELGVKYTVPANPSAAR
ncbi:MAG: S9 family peptidase [Myxococcales bacterium FL481]|nr:MAG: S9 family peptidase [Myxococcales bacterium FL481]